uniref:(northern house mosquito) hypothetical protein n=1 Tax=Culex pipiens TaxID=7175 RepID=A0A8D8B7F0_CULPI
MRGPLLSEHFQPAEAIGRRSRKRGRIPSGVHLRRAQGESRSSAQQHQLYHALQQRTPPHVRRGWVLLYEPVLCHLVHRKPHVGVAVHVGGRVQRVDDGREERPVGVGECADGVRKFAPDLGEHEDDEGAGSAE